jgi:DNA repair protein RadC
LNARTRAAGAPTRQTRRSDDGTQARLLRGEADRLPVYELLATLLEPGLGKARAHEASIRLMCEVPGGDWLGPLRRLARSKPHELRTIGCITEAATARVIAALELGRRFAAEQSTHRQRLTTPEDVFHRFRTRLRDLTAIEYWVIAMNEGHEVLREVMVSRTPEPAQVAGRDVLRLALIEGATYVVLIHNDPTATRRPRPSDADRDMTVDIGEAAALVGLVLWDHVIIGVNGYLSYNEAGILTARRRKRTKIERQA